MKGIKVSQGCIRQHEWITANTEDAKIDSAAYSTAHTEKTTTACKNIMSAIRNEINAEVGS